MTCRIRQNDAADGLEEVQLSNHTSSVDLQVGVLHYSPAQECFPLLRDPMSYVPDTWDLTDTVQRDYFIKALKDQIPTVVEKAISIASSTEGKRPSCPPNLKDASMSCLFN